MIKTKTLHFWTELDVEDVQHLLREHGFGEVTDDSFSLQWDGKGALKPLFNGRYFSTNDGTYLAAEVTVQPPTVIGLALAFMLLGPFIAFIPLFMAISAFRKDTSGLEQFAASYLQVKDTGVDAIRRSRAHTDADPTQDGAAAGAPPSFGTRTTLDSATFRIRSSGQTTLEVSAQGIRLTRTNQNRTLAWTDISRVDTFQGRISVGLYDEEPVHIDASAHAEGDILWLATYLEARNTRWSPPQEARRQAEAQLQKLRDPGSH